MEAPEEPLSMKERDGSRPLLSFVGRLSDQKGIDVLMDALDSYPGDPGFDLAIAGKGELSDWLNERHAASNLGSIVSVLGLVSESEKRWLYENSAAIIIPSRFEGLPTVLLESMHSGTPVVMADVNGLGALVEGYGCGLSVPMEDHTSLAEAMKESAMADSQTRSEWGLAGRKAADSYLWSSVTDSVLEVYHRVVG